MTSDLTPEALDEVGLLLGHAAPRPWQVHTDNPERIEIEAGDGGAVAILPPAEFPGSRGAEDAELTCSTR